MDMAAGVMIGGAFAGIVTALTVNFINPILQMITAGKRYFMEDVGEFASNFGSCIVNFLIMAPILFCLLKTVNKFTIIGKKKGEEAHATKVCPFCQSEINIQAVCCPHCTSQQPEEPAAEA